MLEGAPSFARRLDAPMVGRGRELAALREALSTTPSRERRAGSSPSSGPPGIGKSRLANELRRRASATKRGARRPLPPLRRGDHVLAARETSSARPPATRRWSRSKGCSRARRTRAASRRASPERSASARPPDLRTRRSGRSGGCSSAVARSPARRRLRRPPLGGADLPRPDRVPRGLEPGRADPARLSRAAGAARQAPGLADGDAERDARSRSSRSPSTRRSRCSTSSRRGGAQLRRRWRSITEAAEGNPLFVEQMLAMMTTDDGAAPARCPPSIQALLAARLDRLEPEERAVIERASVIGKGVLARRRRRAFARARTGRPGQPAPDDARPQGPDRARAARSSRGRTASGSGTR